MKNKEKSLIENLLGEDQNFCKPDLSSSSDLSSWSSPDTKPASQTWQLKKKLTNFPAKLKKIPENLPAPSVSTMVTPSLTTNSEPVRYSSKLSKPLLDEIYFKLSNKNLVSLSYDRESLFEPMKVDEELRKTKAMQVQECRSRSLKHGENEPNYWVGNSLVAGERRIDRGEKRERGSKKIFYFNKKEKSVENEFVLLGKGKGGLEVVKERRERQDVFRGVGSSVVLPDIRMRSTISSFSLFNSGVPLINR